MLLNMANELKKHKLIHEVYHPALPHTKIIIYGKEILQEAQVYLPFL